MNSTFCEITFDFNEIFIKRATYSIYSITTGNETNQNQRIEIMEVYSELGRCYSYYSDEKSMQAQVGDLDSIILCKSFFKISFFLIKRNFKFG
jgi:hypothetical protein